MHALASRGLQPNWGGFVQAVSRPAPDAAQRSCGRRGAGAVTNAGFCHGPGSCEAALRKAMRCSAAGTRDKNDGLLLFLAAEQSELRWIAGRLSDAEMAERVRGEQ